MIIQPTQHGEPRKADSDRQAEGKRLEKELEEGLEESFPASDPPAVT